MLMREMRQWICNFIALFVLVLGVCVFDTGAEPVFACSKTVSSCAHCLEAAYEKADVRQNTDAICPTGFISTSQIAAHITNGRRVLRPLLYLFLAAVCELQLTGFYKTGRVTEFTGLVGRFVVLDFIHDADGKK